MLETLTRNKYNNKKKLCRWANKYLDFMTIAHVQLSAWLLATPYKSRKWWECDGHSFHARKVRRKIRSWNLCAEKCRKSAKFVNLLWVHDWWHFLTMFQSTNIYFMFSDYNYQEVIVLLLSNCFIFTFSLNISMEFKVPLIRRPYKAHETVLKLTYCFNTVCLPTGLNH